MYKLKIEAKSGTDLRNQLLALLGETGVTVTALEAQPIGVIEQFKEDPRDSSETRQPYERTAPPVETPKRTRRTKEQIAADEAANQSPEDQAPETGGTEVKEEKIEQKPLKAVDSSFSQQDLINQAIKLGAGKKEDIRSILKEYGVDKIPALQEKDFSAFMEKLKGLENQAAA